MRGAQLLAKWKLTGTVVAGDASFAHVQGTRDRLTQRLVPGARIDGWAVVEIGPASVTMEQGAETVELKLYEEKNNP